MPLFRLFILSVRIQEPVTSLFPDPGTMQSDELSLVFGLSDYAETGDEDSEEEEDKLTSGVEDGLAKQGTIDKPGFLHAFQRILQDLVVQADEAKVLINVVEGTYASDLIAILPVLGSVIGSSFQSIWQGCCRGRILRLLVLL